MPPTVYMISEHEKSNMKSCEDNGEQGLKFSLKYKTNGKELKNVGQRVKRKLEISHVNDCNIKIKRKKRRIISLSSIESSTSCSIENSSTDDYGTDSELIEIDKNKDKNSSKRYIPFTDYSHPTSSSSDADHSQKIVNDAFSDSMCTPNMCHSNTSDDESSRLEDVVKKFTSTKISNANTRHMFELAIATFRLARRNKEVQIKLRELQADTRNLLKSILDNPENKGIKEQLQLTIN